MKFGGKKRIAAVAIATAAVALAGCGGGGGGGGGGGQLSKSDYKKKLVTVSKKVQALRSIGSSGGSASSKLEQLRSGLRSAADELSKVKPPNDAKADNAELASGLRGLADALGPLEKAVKDKNAQEMQSALSKFQGSKAVQHFQHAINDLKSKGYASG